MKRFFPLALVVSCTPVWAQNALRVRVLDPKGAPIAGAWVQVGSFVQDSPVLAPKVTDASGVALFSLPNEANGKPAPAEILVGAKGWMFAEVITAGGKAEVRLQRGAPWRGKIVDENGKPLAGVRLTLRMAMNPDNRSDRIMLSDGPVSDLYSAQSGADGSFQIANLPPDKELMFHAARAGFAVVDGQGGHTGTEELIKMVRSGSLRGRALDVTGKPLAKVEIYAASLGIGGNSATTDAKGAFTIDGLAPGTYRLILMKGLPKTATFIMPRLGGVRVEAGKTAVAPVWRGQKGTAIRGLARDAATKKPIAGAYFAAMNLKDVQRNDDSAWAQSDASGHFVLRVAQAGKYNVRSSGAAFGWMRSSVVKSVTLGASAPPEVVFELMRAPVVRGVTVDEHDKPFAARLTVGMMSMGRDISTGADGKWQYTPSSTEDLMFGGGADDKGYFEVITPKHADFPPTGPIFIKMRHHPWGTLAGRVVTPDGTPVEGVKVQGDFLVPTGGSMYLGASVSATSGTDGRFVLSRFRDSDDLKVSGKKAGFQFQSGGQVSHQGETLSVTDLVFAPLGGKVEGTTEAGAQVVVAGRETRADDRGHFAFDSLPGGQNLVFVAHDGRGGSALAGNAPVEIKLSQPKPQGRNEALAKQIWEETLQDASARNAGTLESQVVPVAFAEAMTRAQARDNQEQLVVAARSWKTGDSLELLRSGLERITNPGQRSESFLRAAIQSGDANLGKRALEVAGADLGIPVGNGWRERNLYLFAVLQERLNGDDAGRTSLSRALEYTIQNHGDKTRFEGIMQTQVGRNEAFCDAASLAALGSAGMLRAVLDVIEDGSGFKVRALAEVVPVVAKTHGLEAALPLLNELKALPAPTLDVERGYVSFDVDWAFGQAVHDLMPLIGAKNPAKALELARQVEGDEQRARALASAAKFQTPAIAAPLYREAVGKISTEDAPRVAAFVWQTDPKLGLQLFAIARRKAEDEMRSDLHGRNSWVPMGFYLSRADPAQARLILEREWARSLEAKVDGDELAAIAVAMAPVDAKRADAMARLVPSDNFGWGIAARRRIARFLLADEATRRGFVLNRIGSRDAWDAGEVQW
jgi:hypothetical protein